jgi:pimeloyl-ACP methyl ester carboxylesterase
MDDHGLDSTCLLGHSMGGKTAMHTALTYPNRVDALVVVDIAPKPYSARHDPIFDALLDLDLAAYPSRPAINDALRAEIPDASVRNFLLKNLKRDASGGYAWQINLDGIYRNYHEINGGLKADGVFEGPTLFVRGGASDYIAEEDTETIISFFPEASIVTIEEAGHWVHSEKPDVFADVVLDFLDA